MAAAANVRHNSNSDENSDLNQTTTEPVRGNRSWSRNVRPEIKVNQRHGDQLDYPPVVVGSLASGSPLQPHRKASNDSRATTVTSNGCHANTVAGVGEEEHSCFGGAERDATFSLGCDPDLQ